MILIFQCHEYGSTLWVGGCVRANACFYFCLLRFLEGSLRWVACPSLSRTFILGHRCVQLFGESMGAYSNLSRCCVFWRCFVKVEPCFRVGGNRDMVLLGLIHALGGRLLCSSAKDLSTALEARPTPSLHPRILDRHVCRSPTLLRAAAEAGVRLYEVGVVTPCCVEVDHLPGLQGR